MESTMTTTTRVNLTIPVEPELREAIRRAAKADDRQMADLCRVILRRALLTSEPAQQAQEANEQPAVQPR